MKLLYVTGLSGRRVNGFMRSAILAANEMNIDFTMVSNMTMADIEGYKEDCKEYGIKTLHIDLDRNPIGRINKKAYEQLCEILRRGVRRNSLQYPDRRRFRTVMCTCG